MTIDLGMPQPAREPLASRRKSRQIMVGKDKHAVPVGGGAPVSVGGRKGAGKRVDRGPPLPISTT